MKLSSFTKVDRLKGILRLCICVVFSCMLALTGISINPTPVQAWDYVISGAPPDATNCQPYTFTFSVSTVPSGCHLTWAYSWATTPLPANLQFDPATGTISGTPVNATPGTYQYKVWVVDDCAHTSPSPNWHFTITYHPCAMSIVAAYIPQQAQENVPFSMALSATGGTGPCTWTAAGLPSGLYINSNGVISGTPSQGSAGTYNVQVTVTDTTGCCAPASGSFLLNIAYATYDFTVKIGPGLTAGSTKVLIDGSEEATLGGGQSETFTARVGKSHVVTVDQAVSSPGQSGTRFTVKGSADKTVSENNNLAYFDYAPAVLMEVNTDPSGVAQLPGSGWHAIGDVFNSSAPSPIDSNSQPGVQYRFKQWRLPDGSTSPNKDLVFTVSTPGAITAVYDTYYLLTLSSDYPPVTDTSWYLKGSNATYGLSLQEAPMMGFWGFLGGKLRPINDSGTHLMDTPFTQKITWSRDYTIPIIIIVIALLVIAGVGYFAYRRRGVPVTRRRAAPKAEAPEAKTKLRLLPSKAGASKPAARAASKRVSSKAKKPAVKKASSKRASKPAARAAAKRASPKAKKPAAK